MNKIKYIFFDCMETIIDMYELPKKSDYAYWAFNGSKVEKYWEDFDEFFFEYENARKNIESKLQTHEEYSIFLRYEYVVNKNTRIDLECKEEVLKKLEENFWNNYLSRCYVHEEVRDLLNKLSEKYKLAIVSNFKVENGVETLLKLNKIDHLFEFIITSINFGYAKPDYKIYEEAFIKSNHEKNEIVFIGDDFMNDYKVPREFGFKTILINKRNQVLTENMVLVKDIEKLITSII
ncbi:HAD family hydrolase [Helicovermis profundi]|uniref:HAD family phosphatase n=1 Tax=Helicovermis profundi TaxID=3065157 RepID=A0AAU9EST7_9FIRM|nr:HAD family phosphatase [Clostridia bacterium S502]